MKEINFPISEKLNLFNISLNGSVMADVIRTKAFELIADSISSQMHSYLNADVLKNPRMCNIVIMPDQTLRVTLFRDTYTHGSAEPEKTEYNVESPFALQLILSAYHLEAAHTTDDKLCKVYAVEEQAPEDVPEQESKK